MKKYKIGYTQGSYDMFHIGHLNVLKNAKSICDYLIVGINSDEFMYEYKNKYSIIPEDERAAIVESIKYVDETHIVNTRDKVKLGEKYRFDCVIMTDQYKGSKFYQEQEEQLKKAGISIVYFPHTKSTSSTEIRKKLYEY